MWIHALSNDLPAGVSLLMIIAIIAMVMWFAIIIEPCAQMAEQIIPMRRNDSWPKRLVVVTLQGIAGIVLVMSFTVGVAVALLLVDGQR